MFPRIRPSLRHCLVGGAAAAGFAGAQWHKHSGLEERPDQPPRFKHRQSSKEVRSVNSEAPAINPLHDVITELSTGGRTSAPRQVRETIAHQGREQSAVVRIVLTGGPCAGKSSALKHLREAAKAEGFDVLTAPEVATVIFNSGWKFPESDDPDVEEQKYNFQVAILKLQLQLERSLTSVAGATGRPSIIVFDRG